MNLVLVQEKAEGMGNDVGLMGHFSSCSCNPSRIHCRAGLSNTPVAFTAWTLLSYGYAYYSSPIQKHIAIEDCEMEKVYIESSMESTSELEVRILVRMNRSFGDTKLRQVLQQTHEAFPR